MSSRPTTSAAPALARRPARRRAGLPFMIGGGALAVLTFLGVIFYTSSLNSNGTTGNVPVVVAAHDLTIRVPITSADLTIAQYRASDVPPLSFSKISDVPDVVAAVNISKGQAVTSNLVVRSSDAVVGPQSGYLPIPAGFVALTIPTGEQVGVAGYIQVGDYISLVAVVQGTKSVNIRTVYTNIPVIRLGAAPAATTAPTPGTSGSVQTGGITTSLTIVVTQCQAEYIAWFLSNGALRYTLESFHDYKPQDQAVDTTCPDATAASGVTAKDVQGRWPSLFS